MDGCFVVDYIVTLDILHPVAYQIPFKRVFIFL